MSAFRKSTRRNGMAVWQILFCLALVSFLCRSIVPVGYMPNTTGAGEGKFALTLCTAGGHTGASKLDLTGQSGKAGSDDGVSAAACPFGIVASQALIPAQDAPVVAATVFHHPAQRLHRNGILPPLPAMGPPLGPRAPPSFLG